jgi:hypothetical protein
MTEQRHVAAAELRGLAQLARDATLGLTDLVEAMHGGIARPWTQLHRAPPARTRGITRLVYRSIRWTTRLTAGGVDAALAALGPVLGPAPRPALAGHPSAGRESFVAALNGVLGDHLAETGNPLAIPLQLRHAGRALPLAAHLLAAAVPAASPRVIVMIHGLCHNDLAWRRREHDHGAALGRDLGRTVLHVRYNSGRHVSTTGRELAELLEAVLALWPVPVEELAMVTHSMGGLVARSACHYAALAGAEWPRLLRHLVFLGTPHHGAPLERGGQWLHRAIGVVPYARPLARLGSIRSAGITDLRHGNLLDVDWQGRDRFADARDRRQPVPLPATSCCAVAGTRSPRPGPFHDRLVGDGLVPLDSALGRHRDPARSLPIPADRQWVAHDTGHLGLLDSRGVYLRIRAWLGG